MMKVSKMCLVACAIAANVAQTVSLNSSPMDSPVNRSPGQFTSEHNLAEVSSNSDGTFDQLRQDHMNKLAQMTETEVEAPSAIGEEMMQLAPAKVWYEHAKPDESTYDELA